MNLIMKDYEEHFLRSPARNSTGRMRSAATITGGDSCHLTKTCAPGRAVRSDDGADSVGGCKYHVRRKEPNQDLLKD